MRCSVVLLRSRFVRRTPAAPPGALREATVLNYSEASRTLAVMLPAEAVSPVRKAV